MNQKYIGSLLILIRQVQVANEENNFIDIHKWEIIEQIFVFWSYVFYQNQLAYVLKK